LVFERHKLLAALRIAKQQVGERVAAESRREVKLPVEAPS